MTEHAATYREGLLRSLSWHYRRAGRSSDSFAGTGIHVPCAGQRHGVIGYEMEPEWA